MDDRGQGDTRRVAVARNALHLVGGQVATTALAIALSAALGGLLFGYDWVVIGGAAKFYEACFHLQDTARAVAAGAGFWAKG